MFRFLPALLLSTVMSLYSYAMPNTVGWHAYQTDHFVLYSTKSKQAVEKILYEFEIFRASVHNALDLKQQKTLVPVEIYILDDPADFTYFARNNAGYFHDTVYGPKIVVGPERLDSLSGQTILFHEYVHYLMRSGSGFRYPTWYNEGIAEYYSTLEIKDDHVVVGKGTIRKSLNQGSIANINATMQQIGTHNIGDNRKRDEYYAASWLLVNFFSLSAVNDLPDYRDQLIQYLIAFNQGTNHDTAFASSFDIKMSDLKSQLKKYTRKRRLNLARLPLPSVTVKAIESEVSPADISRELAFLANPSSDTGAELMANAVSLDDGDAMAYMAIKSAGSKAAVTQQWIDKALLSDSLSAEGLASIAIAYSTLAKYSPKSSPALLTQSKQYFEKALAIHKLPQIHFFYPDVLWKLGLQQQAIDHIGAAIIAMPANIAVNMKAGEYMVRINNYPYARHFIGNVINWSESSQVAKMAQALLNLLPKK
ncbi:hypothetical protein [Aliiglaciecola litoralis]|uniref:DUF1570 domain-containing protein n=1 Tax=Aliiglaciecola litoralis TaxID=582857 RepID=A0ABP3WSJ3_9ALTE